ncbi:MAG: PKD domain-containing protein, partial [Bacteroidota bacterium]
VDWQWNFGDGSTGSGVTINHVFPSSGVYQVCLDATAPNGCVSTICKPVIVVSTGISEEYKSIAIFPNPATSDVQLNWVESIEYIELFNSNGMLLRFIPINSNSYKLDISELNSGIYFIVDNRGIANKFIKE